MVVHHPNRPGRLILSAIPTAMIVCRSSPTWPSRSACWPPPCLSSQSRLTVRQRSRIRLSSPPMRTLPTPPSSTESQLSPLLRGKRLQGTQRNVGGHRLPKVDVEQVGLLNGLAGYGGQVQAAPRVLVVGPRRGFTVTVWPAWIMAGFSVSSTKNRQRGKIVAPRYVYPA